MIDHSDPREERAYSKALARLVEHVGPCPDCAEHVRAVQLSPVDLTSPGAVMDVTEAGPVVLDLSDPAMPLCPEGESRRSAALAARAATPAERLVAFYGLEASDVPPADAHDCSLAAAWMRGNPGEARRMLDTLVERAGPLEEREASTVALRAAFLVGYRRRFPSRGLVPTAEQKERRDAAADRLVAVIVDRYERRHGVPPPADVLESYRRSYDLWIDEMGDLERIASDAERFRTEHARRWGLKALLPPKDPLRELKKIANWIADMKIEEDAGKG